MRLSLIRVSPIDEPGPMTSEKIAGSTPLAWQTAAAIFVQAMAVSGVCEEGFHSVASPHTTASAEFQAHTATGKLNAEIMPITPSGCHCSYMRCCGRSECMVRPYSWRLRPTAKSQMSIIS